MNKKIHTDICIIGAGPAGSCCALGLAQHGYTVCLIESDTFPRQHIGESLTAGILPLLKQLDVLAPIEAAGFYRPDAAILHWGNVDHSKPLAINSGGFQVDRGVFDTLLLDKAANTGVTVLQPATIEPPVDTGTNWRIEVNHQSQTKNVIAQKLVIATGRKTPVKNPLQRLSPPTLAAYAYWKNSAINGIESRVEALTDGWLWGAPLPNGQFNIALFSDPDSRHFNNYSTIHQHYLQSIAHSQLLNGCLAGEQQGELHICDAAAYVSKKPADNRHFFIGSSALGIDPLSSQGVQLAIKTALLATTALHTQLASPQQSKAAIEFYAQKITDIAHQHQKIAERFYTEHAHKCNSTFWNRRTSAPANKATTRPIKKTTAPAYSPHTTQLKLSSEARLKNQPALVGEQVKSIRALHHPGLERPVAFLQNVELARLLEFVEHRSRTTREIIHEWAPFTGIESAYKILAWLLEFKVVNTVEYKNDTGS
ncbi:MAG TPA: FAD-dependent oxidoreductase [Gammaproteobacteria bacterium]|nr:FAD-dependent oxidoreductase [Gammaproteobacteria bacterium]